MPILYAGDYGQLGQMLLRDLAQREQDELRASEGFGNKVASVVGMMARNPSGVAGRNTLLKNAVDIAGQTGEIPQGQWTGPEQQHLKSVQDIARAELAAQQDVLNNQAELVNERERLETALRRLNANLSVQEKNTKLWPDAERQREWARRTAELRSQRDAAQARYNQLLPHAQAAEKDIYGTMQRNQQGAWFVPPIAQFMRTNTPTATMTNAPQGGRLAAMPIPQTGTNSIPPLLSSQGMQPQFAVPPVQRGGRSRMFSGWIGGAPDIATQGTFMPQTQTGMVTGRGPKMPPAYYDAVNQLVAQGLDVRSAAQLALQDYLP